MVSDMSIADVLFDAEAEIERYLANDQIVGIPAYCEGTPELRAKVVVVLKAMRTLCRDLDGWMPPGMLDYKREPRPAAQVAADSDFYEAIFAAMKDAVERVTADFARRKGPAGEGRGRVGRIQKQGVKRN
jgi:hypothetical protein